MLIQHINLNSENSKIPLDTINDIATINNICIKGNTKPWFDSNMIGLIRKKDKRLKKVST